MAKIKNKNVFLSIVLWGLAVLACMYIGSFIVSVVGNVIYYGALCGISVLAVRYIQRKYLKVK